MKDSINERIKEIIDYLGINENKFATEIGVTQSVINSMFKRNTDPSCKLLCAIINVYDFISLEWLLIGKGDMLKSNNQNIGNISNSHLSGNVMNTSGNVVNIPNFNGEKIISPDGKVELCGDAQPIVEKLEVENSSLKNENALLREMINMKNQVISLLEEKLNVNNFEIKK